MKAAPFEYDAPTTPEEAVALLAAHGDEAKVLAGGQSLIPMLALRLAFFERLIDIGRIPSLRGIEDRGDSVWVGAGTTDAAVERGAGAVPLLVKATPFIGHLHIRNRGTLGGSIAHADPAAEYPTVALALDATFDVLAPAGRRTVAAADFFQGVWTTALEADDLLLGASFPVWSGRCGFAVEEFARRHGDFAIAGAAVAVELGGAGDDVVTRCAIALIGMASTPVRAPSAEAAAIAGAPADEVGRLAAADPVDVPTDLHGTAAYRRKVGATVAARAFTAAVTEARAVADVAVTIRVNGEERRLSVPPRLTLADFLRERGRLTGTHLGCEHGVCGACTVLLDGDAVRSCLVLAVQADGAEVTTIEGFSDGSELTDVQQAFRDCHGLQCGFCTPGFIVTVTAFLRDEPEPDDAAIRTALAGNLCRCTGYQGILAAMHQVVDRRRQEPEG